MLGIGFGLMLSPLTAAVLSATPSTRAGLGSSMINTSRQVGSTLGVAVLGDAFTRFTAVGGALIVAGLVHCTWGAPGAPQAPLAPGRE